MSLREPKLRKQVHLAAAVTELDFEWSARVARTAERGLFDFVLLPDSLEVLAALACVTDRLGLAGSVDTTFTEPYELARQFASLDHLSDGRACWNIAASSDAAAGENFRRGGYLPPTERYRRAEQFVAVARGFWDSWAPDAVLADVDAGIYADPNRIQAVEYRSPQFDVRGVASLPAGPQGHPVLLHVDDGPEGRAFGTRHADAMITEHTTLDTARRDYADVLGQVAAWGRDPQRFKVFHTASVVLGEAPAGEVSGLLVGTPEQVAAEIDRFVQADACDGFVLVPHPTSAGLDDVVERVVPLLQERGVYRTEYAGTTLRAHLALA